MSFSYTRWLDANRTTRYRLSRKTGWLAYCDSGPRADLPVLSRAQVATLGEDDLEDYNRARGIWVSNLPVVRTQQVHHAFSILDQVTASTRRDGDRVRANAVLDGPSGLGKTTVAMTYCRLFHRSTIRALGPVTEAGDQRLPVATIQLGAKTTPKGLLVKIASFYAEQVAPSINADRLAEVVLDLVTTCETEVITIDELHFIDPRTKDGQGLSNQLKWLANELSCAFVLTGVGLAERRFFTEGFLGDQAGSTAQTSRRSTPIPMAPFTTRTPAGARAWADLLRELEPQLKLADAQPGVLTDQAQLLFARTQGHIGSLTTLLERACGLAYRSGTETLTEQTLTRVALDNAAALSYRAS
ncbi:MAG: TniB family NTP-binding protein [Candidatus Phosphoribacter sp.]